MVHFSRRSGGTRYRLGPSRQRQNDGGGPSSDPASSSEPEGALEALWDQPEDGRQVEAAELDRRPADGAEGSAFNGAVTRGRGGGGRLSSPHAPAAERLPLRAPGHDPAPDPFVAASPPTAPRYQPMAPLRAVSDLTASGRRLSILVLTRILSTNRFPLRRNAL
jgi:hypothetical protein